MPRYDYRCSAGHVYEKQEPFGSPSEHPCEKCGKPAKRVLVAPPLVFKAGGFYVTSGRDTSSGGGETPAKGVRSKKPPKKSEDSGAATESSASAASDD